MKSIVYFLLLFFCVFTSCSSDDSEPLSSDDPSFFGLSVGAKWVYHYYVESEEGENFEYNGIKSTHTVIGEIEMDDTTIYGIQIEREGEGVCSGCPPLGISEGTQIVSQDNLYRSNLNELIFFVGSDVDDGISSYTQFFQVYNVYKGMEEFESPYGNFFVEVNKVYKSSFSEEFASTSGYIKVSPYKGIVYETISFNNGEPSVKIHLAEYTPGN